METNNATKTASKEKGKVEQGINDAIHQIKEWAEPEELWNKTKTFAEKEMKNPRTLWILAGAVASYFIIRALTRREETFMEKAKHYAKDTLHDAGKTVSGIVEHGKREGNFLYNIVRVAMETFVLYYVKNHLNDFLKRAESRM